VSDRQCVELSFPAQPDMAFLARMTAAGVASRAEFGLDQVEDLRLAIDELYVTLVGEHAVDGVVRLTFEWTAEDVRVSGRLTATAGTEGLALSVNELSSRILQALVDDHGVEETAEGPCMWLTMRRRAER